jgi:hypothetical protein
MPSFRVAHIIEQKSKLIIIPLEPSFGQLSELDQRTHIADLQTHAADAGMDGTLVPVWDAGGGRLGYIAPFQWHAYFSNLTLSRVLALVNAQLYW